MFLVDNLPNLHPAFSHFPIALVAVAMLFDIAAVLADRGWLDRAAAVLYGLGAMGAVAAFLTGQAAAERLDIPPEAMGAVSDHEDTALIAVLIVVPLAVIRAVLAWRDRDRDSLSMRPFRAILALVAVGLAGLVMYTANLGGKLVFEHGLGVDVEVVAEPEPDEVELQVDEPDQEDEEPDVDPTERYDLEEGIASWRPVAADTEALTEVLSFAPGSPEDEVAAVGPDETGGELDVPGLVFEVDGAGLVQLPETYDDVQVDLEVEFVDWEGVVAPAHHIRDFENFEMFRFDEQGAGRLVRRSDGDEEVLDEGRAEAVPDQAFELAVSASGRHFYGRLDGEALAHGHASPEPEGGVGMYLEGEGRIRVHSVTATPIE